MCMYNSKVARSFVKFPLSRPLCYTLLRRLGKIFHFLTCTRASLHTFFTRMMSLLRCHCTNDCNSFDSISILFFECVTKYTFSKCLFPSKLYTAYKLSLGGFIFCIMWILSFVVPSFYIFIHLTFLGNLMKLSLLI